MRRRIRSVVTVVVMLVCSFVVAQEKRGDSSVYDKYPLVTPIAGEETEDFERTVELYKEMFPEEAGKLRVTAYAELTAIRQARGLRHLPAGNGFDFGRRMRPDGPGETGPNGCAWVSAGPTNINGRVTSIAVDPTDGNKIYATTVGGIWRSLDAGRRWQRVSDEFLSTVFSSVAVNPSTPSEVVAGGGDSSYQSTSRGGIGIWRSNNFGAPGTWTKVSTPDFDNKVIYRIRFDPAPPNDLYVASTHGVWLGVHNGGNITFSQIGSFNADTSDVVVDFSALPRKVYAGVRSSSVNFAKGIWKWNGSAWAKKDGGIPTNNIQLVALALAKTSPTTLFARMVASDGQQQGIYKTSVAGEGANAWAILPNASIVNDSGGVGFWYSWYNNVIEIDPTDASRVYAAGLSTFRSINGGVDWEKISAGADPSYPYWTHGDHHAFAFDPVNPKIVYAGNDGGIDKSTDISKPVWHWRDASHGMVMTEFYYTTSSHEHPTLLAGGSQDNGTEITFGNRTWYNPGGCDGFQVGSDAKNPDTLYANCNHSMYELANPVPGTIGGQTSINWVTPVPVHEPAVTDRLYAGGALASGGDVCGKQTVLKTTDGVNWAKTNTNFPAGGKAIVIASASVANFKTYMAGVIYSPPSQAACPGFQSAFFTATMYRTDDGGVNWTANATGLPSIAPASIVFDPTDKFRVYLSYYSSGLYMTTNATNYYQIAGSGPTGLPPSAQVREVAVDPADANVVYAATSVGVFRGVITPGAPPSAVWTPFDEGMPDGTIINGVWTDPKTGILYAGTFGHGMYRRDIRAAAACKARMLVVRDNVYDDGDEPSPFGIPDAEHPIPDPVRPQFYKPDDTAGGRTYWWTSGDIRVDVPSAAPFKNAIASADHIEFEVCPTAIADCPAGTMVDAPPQSGKIARVYVQVQNRGVESVANTRVLAIWVPLSAGLPPLPPSFWTTTFPANGPCGALDPSTGWKLVDPVNPCRNIAAINPEIPELARFDWNVPIGVDGHACILTVVESPEDPLDPKIRAQNLVKPEDFVPISRHIAQRNLTVKPFKLKWLPILFPIQIINPPEERGFELVLSKPDLRENIQFALPKGMIARPTFGAARPARIEDPEMVRQIEAMGLDPNNAWDFSGEEAGLFVEMRPGERATIAVVGTPGADRTSSRFSVVQRIGRKVLGGNVYLFRPEPQ
jgi:hypothetical protein